MPVVSSFMHFFAKPLLYTTLGMVSLSSKVQRDNESIEEARKQLLKASSTKGCILKILIRTKPYHYEPLFNIEDIDDNLLIIDSHELSIDQWLASKIKSAMERRSEGLPSSHNL